MATGNSQSFLIRWLITTVAVLAATQIVPGIEAGGTASVIITALLLGVLNVVLKPFLVLLTLPLQILTLGLFMLVINALLLLLAGALVPSFRVDGFWTAVLGGLVISIVSMLLNLLTGGDKGTKTKVVYRDRPVDKRSRRDDGKGPVIDV